MLSRLPETSRLLSTARNASSEENASHATASAKCQEVQLVQRVIWDVMVAVVHLVNPVNPAKKVSTAFPERKVPKDLKVPLVIVAMRAPLVSVVLLVSQLLEVEMRSKVQLVFQESEESPVMTVKWARKVFPVAMVPLVTPARSAKREKLVMLGDPVLQAIFFYESHIKLIS
jgi:hypothetical protein